MCDRAAVEERLSHWLRDEAGIAEPRRVVSHTPQRILLSKFAAGFAEGLRRTLERVPQLFDIDAATQAYQAEASLHPDASRVETWRTATSRILVAARDQGRLTPAQCSEVQAGIDSVAAMLSGILWSEPSAAAGYEPLPGEVQAFQDAIEQLDSDGSHFTRRYGVFDGAEVVNHCPGAPYARTFLHLGWVVCTGTPPPVLSHRHKRGTIGRSRWYSAERDALSQPHRRPDRAVRDAGLIRVAGRLPMAWPRG